MIVLLLALAIGVLYGTGVYLLLRRSLLKFILALGLISNGTHLLIFTGAGLTRGNPPLIGADSSTLGAGTADPLPQALILTAIVISFGLTAFVLLLLQRTYAATGTDDPDRLTTTDHLDRYQAPTIPRPNLPGIETGHGSEGTEVPPQGPPNADEPTRRAIDLDGTPGPTQAASASARPRGDDDAPRRATAAGPRHGDAWASVAPADPKHAQGVRE